MSALGAVGSRTRNLIWIIKGILGENAYAEYRAHLLSEHPGETPMTERAFWRDRSARREANPEGGCC